MANANMAVIGCGASSVILLAAIARNPDAQGFKVDIYERTGNYGRGIAYSTPHKIHLLNVRARNMSAYADDKDHFKNWVIKHGYDADDFVPRTLYGEYLDEILEDVKVKLTLNFLNSDVKISRKISNECYELTVGSQKREYSYVVQATGNAYPIRPKLDPNPMGYIDNPWIADYTMLSTKSHIALIGSGLSAVDTILALYAKNFKGKISVFSRHGLFPAKHEIPTPCEPFLWRDGEKLSPYYALNRVRKKIVNGTNDVSSWQGVMDALRPHTNIVWENWTRKEREKFMKRLFTLWNVHRHRMAPQIADVIQILKDSGRIEMFKASVEKIASGPFIHTDKATFPCDAVINCMGHRTREDGYSFDVFDKIGPARFGDQFETTAIPEIRVQAKEIAGRILKKY